MIFRGSVDICVCVYVSDRDASGDIPSYWSEKCTLNNGAKKAVEFTIMGGGWLIKWY